VIKLLGKKKKKTQKIGKKTKNREEFKEIHDEIGDRAQALSESLKKLPVGSERGSSLMTVVQALVEDIGRSPVISLGILESVKLHMFYEQENIYQTKKKIAAQLHE